MSTYNLLANNNAFCKGKRNQLQPFFSVSDAKLLGLFWHLRSFSIICCESSNNEWSGIIRFHVVTYLGVHYALLTYFRYFIREYANIYYSKLMYIRITKIIFFIIIRHSSSRIFFSLTIISHYRIFLLRITNKNNFNSVFGIYALQILISQLSLHFLFVFCCASLPFLMIDTTNEHFMDLHIRREQNKRRCNVIG